MASVFPVKMALRRQLSRSDDPTGSILPSSKYPAAISSSTAATRKAASAAARLPSWRRRRPRSR